MNKQPEITDATRNHIINTFWTVYKTKSINKITVGEVAINAQIHRSTFYRYFHDVYEIYEKICDDEIRKYQLYLEKVLVDHNLFEYEKTIVRITAYIAEHGEKFYYLFGNKGLQTARDKLIENMKTIFFRLSGLDKSNADSEYYMVLLINILFTNLNFWYEHQNNYKIEDIGTLCMPIIKGFIF